MLTRFEYPFAVAMKCIAGISLFFFLVAGCATTGPSGKKSFIVIPTSQEVAIGSGMAEQIAQTEKSLPDPLWQNYLNEIGQKLVGVSDRKDIEYHFTVIESDQINAFAAPGGFVYFYTGLIREMHNEGELAAVMAHEISHVVARHGIKRLQASLGIAAAYQLVFGGDDASAVVNAAIGVGMGLVFAGYSRENEREADRFGAHYMVQAGYDPGAMITMFGILAEKGGRGSGSFEKLVSSHPDTQERINNAKAQIAGMKPLPAELTLGEQRFQQMLKRLPAPDSGQ